MEKDEIVFELIPENSIFSIDKYTGVIKTKVAPLPLGLFQFIVNGTDNGIPPLPHQVNIMFNITSDGTAVEQTETPTAMILADGSTTDSFSSIFTPDSYSTTSATFNDISTMSSTGFKTPIMTTSGDTNANDGTVRSSSAENVVCTRIITIMTSCCVFFYFLKSFHFN